MRPFFLTFLFVYLSFQQLGCKKESEFSGDSKSKAQEEIEDSDSEGKSGEGSVGEDGPLTKEFVLHDRGTSVDMIWVLDNSDTMESEVAQVNKNFGAFIRALRSSKLDVRVGMLSCENATAKTCINLPEEDKAFITKKSSGVGSWDGLSIFASAVCEKSRTSLEVYDEIETNGPVDEHSDGSVSSTSQKKMTKLYKGEICGEPYDTKVINTGIPGTPILYVSTTRVISMAGFFQDGFLRNDSKKVFVFVTDDNPIAFQAARFGPAMDKQFGAGNHRLFAFAGKSSSPCQIARVGHDFESLAAKSGGEVFDICASDWTAHFEKLKDGIRETVDPAFKVESKTIEIQSVTLNGRKLKVEEYSLKEGTVILASSVVYNEGDKLVVTYVLKA
ncbi:MAG: hypothetical protein AB7T49_13135 [Oligoflexales bacterium]